jgi:hypothetical protein
MPTKFAQSRRNVDFAATDEIAPTVLFTFDEAAGGACRMQRATGEQRQRRRGTLLALPNPLPSSARIEILTKYFCLQRRLGVIF